MSKKNLAEPQSGGLAVHAEKADKLLTGLMGEESWEAVKQTVDRAVEAIAPVLGAGSAFDRAFRLETAHTNRRSLQEMLLTDLNPQFAADAQMPLKDKLPTIHGMSIDLQRRANAYSSLLDDVMFQEDKLDPEIQHHVTDVAVSAVQLIDVLGKPAVEEFMNKLDASNKDIHLRIPKVTVF